MAGAVVKCATHTKYTMADPDSLPCKTAFGWFLLVGNFSHVFGKIGARFFKIISEFRVCRSLPDKCKLCLLK